MKKKQYLISFLFLLFGILGLAAPLQAFQVDVSQVYYSDAVRTVNNYDFSTGTKTGDIITIPAGFVTKPAGESALSYTYGLFPGATGITFSWTPPNPCIMQTTTSGRPTNGGAIISTTPSLPDASSAQTAWTYGIKLQNFRDMSAGMTYKNHLGMGSETSRNQPMIAVIWLPNGYLQLVAKVGDIWQSLPINVPGLTPSATILEFRMENTGSAINFLVYNTNQSRWDTIGTFTSAEGYVAADYKGFPVLFPFVDIEIMDAFHVQSGHQNNSNGNQYYANLYLDDPDQATYASVSVASSGSACGDNLPPTALNYRDGQWWLNTGVYLSTNTKPACFPTYTFTAVKKAGGTDTVARTVTGYVEQFATNLSPTGNVPTAPTFSWTGITGAHGYYVQIQDASHNNLWGKWVDAPQNSVAYSGPSLNSGQTYTYYVIANVDTSGQTNTSMAQGSFTYTGATTITVSGYVRDLNGNVISSASGVGGNNGVFVCSASDCANKNTFASPETGFFQLAGLPPNTPFMLRLYNQNYAVVFSPGMAFPSDVTLGVDNFGGINPFLMPTTAQLTALGILPDSGKAVIMGGVSDGTYRGCTVGGVAVTAKGSNGSGKDYPVAYLSPFGVLDGSAPATYPNGVYYVLNVDPADNNIVVTSGKQGWTFNPATFVTVYQPSYPVSVSEGRVLGVAPSYAISLGGVVKDLVTQAVIANANIAINGNPGKFTTSNAQGNFTLTDLPSDAHFYARVTAAGYVPAYVAYFSLKNSFPATPAVMVTPQQMASNFGVTGNNGLLVGGIRDSQLKAVSGATVVLTSKNGVNYTPGYFGGGSSTDATGGFFVSNVQPGDVVKVDVTKAGYTFKSSYLNGFASSLTEKLFIADQAGALYANFTNAGIWKYSGTGTNWDQVTASNPDLLVTVGSTLYGTFPGLGIWKFNGTTWDQTTTSVPAQIVGTATTLYGAFTGLGIWQWNGTQWNQTTTSNPQTIIASTSDLYGTFEGLGIWKWNGTAWSNLTSSIPDKMVTSGIKLYGAFSGLGIWLWNGTQWEQATTSNPQLIAASSAKLYGSFTGAGIWEWDGAATWKQISPDTPTQMTASNTELYAVFAGIGVKKWDGATWSLISGNEPVIMVVGE